MNSNRPKVTYLCYGDILSNVFDSQLLPLWSALTERGNVELNSLVFLSPGVLGRGLFRDRVSQIRRLSPIPLTISYTGVGYPPRWQKLVVMQLRRFLKKHKPNVIHARGTIAAGIAALTLEDSIGATSTRLIYDARGDTIAELEGDYLRQERAVLRNAVFLARGLEIKACQKASSILAVSSPLASVIRSRYGYDGKIFTIPCWGEKPDTLPGGHLERAAERHALNIPRNDFVWAYAGSTSKWQALDSTLELFVGLARRFSDHTFLFISKERDAIEAMVVQSALPLNRVRFSSGGRSKVLKALRASDAAVLLRDVDPVNRVACPMKFADYMLCSLPVLLGPEIGDLNQWVAKYRVGCSAKSLSVKDVFEAALRIIQLVQDEPRIGAHTNELFSRELDLNLFLEVYESRYRESLFTRSDYSS